MNLLARDLWQEVRESFRAAKGAAVADLWLQQTWPMGFSKGVFTLGVPNRVVAEWMEHRYLRDLEAIFHDLTGSRIRVRLQVEDSLPEVSSEVAQASVGEVARPFVVRPENKLAFAAVQRVLREPESGNPLFLHGPAGCGKSALVAHLVERHAGEQPGRTSVSITAEAFSEGVVRAIRERRLAEYRGRMLAADALVLEEAHRLRSKPRTQREFLNILRYFVERHRPVVLTSRHPPNAIFLLDEALRSYFLSGLLVRVSEYSHASRVAVLEAHARRFPRAVPLEVIERIAVRIGGTFDRQVRYLEKVAAYAALEGRPATLDLLSQGFPELQGDGSRDLDLRGLIERVAQEFGTTPDEIASNRKVRSAVLARHLVIYLATEVFNLRARRVMRHLGGLSPSTTAYARRKIEERRRNDPVFEARVKRMLEQIDGGQKTLFS